MKQDLDRFCVRECIKDGEIHEFKGPVKVVLEEPPEDEDRWRILGSGFVTMAHTMMSANLAIDIIYSLSYRENLYYSAHCLLCTVGLQFCLPLSILVLHTMYGPTVSMKREQRRREHVLFSLLGIACFVLGSSAPFLDPRECTPYIHSAGAYVTGAALGLSVATGFLLRSRKKEINSPAILTVIHRFWGMVSLLGSAFTYITSIGGCRATMKFWLYTIGREAPLYMIYFLVIFYTLVVLFIPGSKFIMQTKYNYDNTVKE